MTMMLWLLMVPLDVIHGTLSRPPMPPVETMPVLMTHYMPEHGGINCGADCATLADGTRWALADVGNVAACIPDWFGRVIETAYGTFRCRDQGGAVQPFWSRYWQRWVIPVDVLWHSSRGEFEFNYWIDYNWRLR
jgi:hypothetical protein